MIYYHTVKRQGEEIKKEIHEKITYQCNKVIKLMNRKKKTRKTEHKKLMTKEKFE